MSLRVKKHRKLGVTMEFSSAQTKKRLHIFEKHVALKAAICYTPLIKNKS